MTQVGEDQFYSIEHLLRAKRRVLDFLRRNVRGIKYIIKIEFQTNHMPHFHLLVSHNVGHILKPYWETSPHGRKCHISPVIGTTDEELDASIKNLACYFSKKGRQTDVPPKLAAEIKERGTKIGPKGEKGSGFRFWTATRGLVKDLGCKISAEAPHTAQFPGRFEESSELNALSPALRSHLAIDRVHGTPINVTGARTIYAATLCAVNYINYENLPQLANQDPNLRTAVMLSRIDAQMISRRNAIHRIIHKVRFGFFYNSQHNKFNKC